MVSFSLSYCADAKQKNRPLILTISHLLHVFIFFITELGYLPLYTILTRKRRNKREERYKKQELIGVDGDQVINRPEEKQDN